MINVDKSKKIKKVLSCILVGGTLLTNGTIVYAEQPMYDEQLQYHINFEAQQLQYYEKLASLDPSDFDENFVSFYQNGCIKIGDKTYDLRYLILTYDESEIHLVYSKDNNIDILTNMVSETGFHNENNILFKDSSIFLKTYSIFGCNPDNELVIGSESFEDFLNLFENYDGSIQRETPETFLKYEKSYKHFRQR